MKEEEKKMKIYKITQIKKSLIFLTLLFLLPNLTTPHTDKPFKCIHSKLDHSKIKSKLKNNSLKFSKTSKFEIQKKTQQFTTETFNVEIDWTIAMKFYDKELLAYLKTLIFTKVVRYLRFLLKIKNFKKYDFSNSEIECYENSKFSQYFLSRFNGGLGLLVTFGGTEEDGYLAWSGPCALDPSTNRPIFGQINLNPAYMNLLSFRKLFDTIIHEIFHVIGFSPDLFEYFVNDNLERIDIKDIVELDPEGEIPIGLKTPKLIAAAKKHYNCQDVKYIPLENEGGDGSAISHFERTALMNEVMTASDVTNTRISVFTLSFLEDTGWYVVNHYYDEQFTFGKYKGCEFILKNFNGKENSCSYVNQIGCFYDFSHQAVCYWDQFAGGAGESEGSLRYFSSHQESCMTRFGGNERKESSIFGEYYGDTSRCFKGELNRNVDNDEDDHKISWMRGVNVESSTGTFCFKASCEEKAGSVRIKIYVKEKEYICDITSQFISVDNDGIKGQIECPNIADFCLHSPRCRNNCEAKGRCLDNGVCYIFD